MYLTKSLYGEAEPLMRRVLMVFIGNLGVQHPNSVTVLNNYAVLLHDLGKSRERN